MITTLPPQYLLSLASYSALECNIKCDLTIRHKTEFSSLSLEFSCFPTEHLKISNGLIRNIIDIEVSNMIYRQIISEML